MPPGPDTSLNGGDVEEGDENKELIQFDIKALPNEVLEQVFAHLDLRTWKSVRQVCRRFQAVGNGKGALNNFTMVLKARRVRQVYDLINITESVPWTKLRLGHFDVGELQGSGSYLSKGLDKLGQGIRTRMLRTGVGLRSLECPLRRNDGGLYSNFYSMRGFLLQCSQSLERVGVLRMSEIRNVLIPYLDKGGVNEFPEMKSLMVAFDMDAEYCDTDLLKMMERCPRLRRLDLLFADQDERPMTILSFEASVIAPIVTYLYRRVECHEAASLPAPSFTVKFASEAYRCSIPFDFPALQKLLGCARPRVEGKEGIELYFESLPFLALPTKRQIQSASIHDPEILERLDNSIKSIVGTMQDLKTSTMEIERDSFHSSCRHLKPASAKLSLVIYLPCGNKVYLTCPSHLLPMDIQSITIISENTRATMLLSISDEEDEGRQSFIEELLLHRPGLEELKIITESDKKLDLPFLTQDCVNFKHFDGFHNFPNLQILHLDYWGRTQQDFWSLYESLPLLKELVLRKCYRLTDDGIVGDEEGHSMLRLKNLRHLTIEGYWSITDASFVKVFSKLKLAILQVWDDPDKDEKPLTMKSLHSLRTSPCGKVLQFLQINKPVKTSLADVKKALINCRCLKRVELVEGAGAGSKTAKSLIHF